VARSDEQIERADKQRERRVAAKALPPTARKGGGVADWHNANPENVLRLVCVVAVSGGAVRFGYTRDGGAYSIGIYSGELSKTYYCNEKDGIDGTIKELIEYFEG